MIKVNTNKLAGLYAEAIYNAVMENNTVETTKNVSETLNKLLDEHFPEVFEMLDNYEIKDLAHRHTFRACQIANVYKALNEPIDLGDEEFWGHINELIEHQND